MELYIKRLRIIARISWRARTAANYVYWLHVLFIYLIPEDVLSGNSTIFGVAGAL